MAKNRKVSASNRRHDVLANLNSKKWLHSPREKGRVFNIRRGYHVSVIDAQERCNRILTKDERKRVYKAVKSENGRPVICSFKK